MALSKLPSPDSPEGLRLAADYKAASPSQKDDYFKYLFYLGALHDFFFGVKTNIYLFLKDPDGQELDTLGRVSILIDKLSDEEQHDVVVRHIFGGQISTVRPYLDGKVVYLHP